MFIIIGFKYQNPPPLASNHVNRQTVLDEIVTKLLHAINDPNMCETTLTITGAGGFGKTSTVISLCHHDAVKECFTNGFLFIELGPQASDPSIKLNQLYHLLTGEYLKYSDINHAEQEIKQLTSNYFHNLLVIIDDVWHVEDAEPLVKAFTYCKTILTTRMNDIEQHIPSKQSVVIGPMTQHEAICVLTTGVVDSTQLSQEDVGLLDELAQDVHLWPLLLSLIRGQLLHNLKQYHLSHHQAIQNVQAKLHHKGLTAFDKNNIEKVNKSRKIAVKACVEITLELLTKPLSDKIKSLILYTGIGISVQTAVLDILWNISKQDALETADQLWAYGLVQFTDIATSPNNATQHCIEVHAVISQYIIECMDSQEACALSPIGGKLHTAVSVGQGVKSIFQHSYGVRDQSLLSPTDFLKYKQSQFEDNIIAFYLTSITMLVATDPHDLIVKLQQIRDDLDKSNLLQLLDKEINSIISECRHILRNTHQLCRKLNQSTQKNIYEKHYDNLIPIVEDFIKNYPLCNVAQKAVTMVKNIIPYCDGKLLQCMLIRCEGLQMRTIDYHDITTLTLPYIKFFVKLYKRITSSLLNGLPDIEMTYGYFKSFQFNEEHDLVHTNYLIKLQEIAPNYVQIQAAHRFH